MIFYFITIKNKLFFFRGGEGGGSNLVAAMFVRLRRLRWHTREGGDISLGAIGAQHQRESEKKRGSQHRERPLIPIFINRPNARASPQLGAAITFYWQAREAPEHNNYYKHYLG